MPTINSVLLDLQCLLGAGAASKVAIDKPEFGPLKGSVTGRAHEALWVEEAVIEGKHASDNGAVANRAWFGVLFGMVLFA